MKGNKTDRKDADWICDLCICDMIKPSFIPPADIRELRDLIRYQYKIWRILSDLKPYTPDGFLESRPVKKEKVLTTSQTFNLLKQRGYLIKDDSLPAS